MATTGVDIGEKRPERRGSRWSLLVWIGAIALWLLPLVAMQFSREVAWTAFDFGVWGAMLLVACGLFELTVRLSRNTAYRAATGVAIIAAFGLVWVNLAVGIIGDENNPANLMYAAVLLVGILGAVIARFKSGGMALVLVIMALAQGSVGAVALMGGQFTLPIDAGFAVLWLLSAALFAKAARDLKDQTSRTAVSG